MYERLPRVFGLDIEADSETAEPFLLGVDGGAYRYVCRLEDWGTCVRGLCRNSLERGVNFFYNLQYDFEGMLRFVEKEAAVKLITGEKVRLDYHGEIVDSGGHWVSYIPRKGFSVSIGKQVWRYFDAWQYFLTSLRNAVEKNLPGEEKGDVDTGEISFERYLRDEEYRSEVDSYCLQDARLCRLLGEIIVTGANKYVRTDTFFSSAGVSELYFRSNGFRVMPMPGRVTRDFMKCYFGGRFEACKRGLFEGVVSIDIKSAYPKALSEMAVLNEGFVSKPYNGSVDFGARFGAYSMEIHVPEDWYLGPVPVKMNGVLCFPVGRVVGWFDLETVKLLDDLGVEYVVHEGWEIFQDEVGSIAGLINGLFRQKEDRSNPPAERYAAKINMNGLYGKLIQLIDDVSYQEVKEFQELDDLSYADLVHTYDKWFKRVHSGRFTTGRLFAPYYASYVTSYVRNMLLRKCFELGEESVIALHTDSVLYKGEKIEPGTGLGDWEIDGEFDCAELGIVKAGVYKLKQGERVKVRARGIGRADDITLDSYQVKRRYGLTRALKKDWGDLNLIKDVVLNQSLNADRKRVWEAELTRLHFEGRYGVDSVPILLTD